MGLLGNIAVQFALLGAVVLVALLAFERALVSETWRQGLYIVTGIFASLTSFLLVFGIIEDWEFEMAVYGAAAFVIAFWLLVRRTSDHSNYRVDPEPADPMSGAYQTDGLVFESSRAVSLPEAPTEESDPKDPVFKSLRN